MKIIPLSTCLSEGHAHARLSPAPRDTRYTWASIFGAVCPDRGATTAMDAHLAEIARTVPEGADAVLALDGAGGHGAKALRVSDDITLLRLPPYAPKLEPVETALARLRANRFAITVFDTSGDIAARRCDAWICFAKVITPVRSIATRDDAQTVKG